MITIGYSTRVSNPKYKEYLQKTCMYKEVEIIEKINNGGKSLSQVYNEIINESSNDIVVLCHDDLEFDTKRWGEKILKNFEKNPEYGILGLAGSKYLDSSGQWWKVPQTMYGIVNHKHDGKKWTSTYSQNINDKIQDTIIVDGLFIVINKQKIKHGFDETIKGFHFYDLGFCLPNYLSEVKIGVIFNVRVTHLSIGQTNQQWEENRILFSNKYKNELPIDITQKEKTNQTYIFIHDQELLLEFEKNKKFEQLKKPIYVFVGNKDCSKIEQLDNVIISRNYENNIEKYPLFTAFTGWFMLWKNNLIKSDYVTLIEYDVILNSYFEQTISKLLIEDYDMVGYIPHRMDIYHYIKNPDWVQSIFTAFKKVHKIDVEREIKYKINRNPDSLWSATNNITFKTDVFHEYMKWIEPIVYEIKEDRNCGHAQERAISFFYTIKNKKIALTNGLIKHFQLNSHGTQPHYVDYKTSHEKLIHNNL